MAVDIDPASRLGRRLRRLAVQQKVVLKRDARRASRRRSRFARVHHWWSRKRGRCWVVTQDVAGNPVRYFRYDYNRVWVWSPSRSRAARFTTRKGAYRGVASTTMPDTQRFTVRLIRSV